MISFLYKNNLFQLIVVACYTFKFLFVCINLEKEYKEIFNYWSQKSSFGNDMKYVSEIVHEYEFI